MDASNRHLWHRRSVRCRRAPLGVNPKNLALCVAASASIAATGSSGGEAAVALTVFVVVASLTILAPVVIFFALGQRAALLFSTRSRFGWQRTTRRS
jgi:hypothetical protein